ncbi:hypothetical protein G7Z17_g6938 [Cylindrodendrum hubeiense]|uniref:FAD-binding domain-containing protein n=1 Tax=Cylindrodendrum hubeiense TaxID=595255 RepID=A0A9P5H8V2_9HYPO|nr:hypothetical protein G7Z17_g6938 [Cylindrodendrum hubeiense]
MRDAKIKTIIVGAGFAGLSTAIELSRKNVGVEIFERVQDLSTTGDVILMSANCTRIMGRWDNVLEQAVKISGQPERMTMCTKEGHEILDQPLPEDYEGAPNIFSSRGRIQQLMVQQAQKLGIPIHLGHRVDEYFEDNGSAGVIVNGVRHTADYVICCDGIHSRGRVYVTGSDGRAKSSGFAVYRSWFPLERLAADPLTKKYVDADSDHFQDTYTLEESWSFPGEKDKMLKVIEDWDDTLKAVVQAIPPDALIDWKLLWRDPVKRWISDGGRIALAGDSAHPHLATSGSGAAQAIEDAATIATVISRGGRDNIRTSLKIYETLRYHRTSLTQRMGWETRHRWHQTDWEAVKKNPEFLRMPQPGWLYGHDAEKYAGEKYEEAASHILNGTPFVSTNIPEGYVYEEWTVEEMMAKENKSNASFYKIDNK